MNVQCFLFTSRIIFLFDKYINNIYPSRTPIAVGTAAMSGNDMFDSAMRGKGVHVLHILGDELW